MGREWAFNVTMIGKITIGRHLRQKPINTTRVPHALLLTRFMKSYTLFVNSRALCIVKCMMEQERLEEIVKQFEEKGITAVMTTPPKIIIFVGSLSSRQSLWQRGDQLETGTRCKACTVRHQTSYHPKNG